MRGPAALESYLRSKEQADEGAGSTFDLSGPKTSQGLSRSAVLLLHANAQIGLDMCEWCRW